MKYIYLFIFSFMNSVLWASDIYVLGKSLQFSSHKNMSDAKVINVNSGITLFKILEQTKDTVKVEMIQKNSKSTKQILYVSKKWFNRGTSIQDDAIVKFNLNPNDVIAPLSAPKKDCPEIPAEMPVAKKIIPKLKTSNVCENILENPDTTNDQYLICFKSIQDRFQDRLAEKKQSKRAYNVLSGLYELSKEEQKFMAYILTMYGEARGTVPREAQMAAVMQVIKNRTRQAREKGYPEANELDTVLQNNQFSIYRTKDKNWLAGMTATSDQLADVIKVYRNVNKYVIEANKNKGKLHDVSEKVYHFISHQLNLSQERPDWATSKNQVAMTVNGKGINNSNGHVFFQNVPWTFEPNNKYKRYAIKEGLI